MSFWFTSGLFRMCLALLAYSRVLRVSCVGGGQTGEEHGGEAAASGSDGMDCTSRLDEEGDTVAMMEVFVRPPRESCRILVSFDSLWRQVDHFHNNAQELEDSGTVEMRLFFFCQFQIQTNKLSKIKIK